MAYTTFNTFKLKDLTTQFHIQLREDHLYTQVQPIEPSAWFQTIWSET